MFTWAAGLPVLTGWQWSWWWSPWYTLLADSEGWPSWMSCRIGSYGRNRCRCLPNGSADGLPVWWKKQRNFSQWQTRLHLMLRYTGRCIHFHVYLLEWPVHEYLQRNQCMSTYRHEGLFEKDRLQGRVQEFSQVLTQDWHSDADTVLQGPQELSVRQLDDLQTVLGFLVSDPSVGLSINIEHINQGWDRENVCSNWRDLIYDEQIS